MKTTAFDLQMNPAAPSLSFHKLDKAKDKRFWSARVNADVRLIVHRTDASRDVSASLREASRAAGDHKFSALFLRTEWDQVVDAWQLATWEAYRDVQRLGRRTRCPRLAVRCAGESSTGQERMRSRGLMTEAGCLPGACGGSGWPAASLRCCGGG